MSPSVFRTGDQKHRGYVDSWVRADVSNRYRYALCRVWNAELQRIMFIGLNPSTADEHRDDPTLRRCLGFAKAWGFGSLFMLNIYAYRATDPRELATAPDPVGTENLRWLKHYHFHESNKTVAAWGSQYGIDDHLAKVLSLRRNGDTEGETMGDNLWCLGVNNDGSPRHPLYIKADTELVRYCKQWY